MISIIRYPDQQIAVRSRDDVEMVNESLVRRIEQGRVPLRIESLSAVQYLVPQQQLPDEPSKLHVEQYNRIGDTVQFMLSDGRNLVADEMREEPYRSMLEAFLMNHPEAQGDVALEIVEDQVRDDNQYWFKVYGSDHFEPAYRFQPEKVDDYFRVRLNPSAVLFGTRWVAMSSIEKNPERAMPRFIRENDLDWIKLDDQWIRAEDLTPDQFLSFLKQELAVRLLVFVQMQPGSFLPEVDLGAIESVNPTTFLVKFINRGLQLEFETVAKSNPGLVKRYAAQQDQPFRSVLLDRLFNVTTPQIEVVLLTYTSPDGSDIRTIETSTDPGTPPSKEQYSSMQYRLDNGTTVTLDRVDKRVLDRFRNGLDEQGRLHLDGWVRLERDRVAAEKAKRAVEIQERRNQYEISFDLCASNTTKLPYATYQDVRSFVESVLGPNHDDVAKQTYEYLVLIEWGYVTKSAKEKKLRETFRSFFRTTWDPVLDNMWLDRVDVFYRVLCALQLNQGVLRLLEREEAFSKNNDGKFWDYSLRNDSRIEQPQDQVYARMMRDIKNQQYLKRIRRTRGTLRDYRSNLEMLREMNLANEEVDRSNLAREYLQKSFDRIVPKRKRVVLEDEDGTTGAGLNLTVPMTMNANQNEMVQDEKVPVGMVQDEMVPVGMVQDEMVPVDMVQDEMVAVDMVQDEMVPVDMVQDEMVPVDMVQDEKVPVDMVQDEMVPVDMVQDEKVPVGMVQDEIIEKQQRDSEKLDLIKMDAQSRLSGQTITTLVPEERDIIDVDDELNTSENRGLEKQQNNRGRKNVEYVEKIQDNMLIQGLQELDKVEEWVTKRIPWDSFSPFADDHYKWTQEEWLSQMASLSDIFDNTVGISSSGLQRHQRFIKMLTSPASPFHRVLFMHEMGTGKTLASICSTALWWTNSYCAQSPENVKMLMLERNELDAPFIENLNQQLYRPAQKRKRKDPLEITYDVGVMTRLSEVCDQLNRCGPEWIGAITVITKVALQTNWRNDLMVAANGLCLQSQVKMQFCTFDEVIKEEIRSSGLQVSGKKGKDTKTETLYKVNYSQSQFNNMFLNNCIVIVDEAQLYMSENIQNTKDKQVFHELLRKYTFRTPCLFLLSATPIQNNLIELGQMYNILNPFGYRIDGREGTFRMAQFSSESSQGFGQFSSEKDNDGVLDGIVDIKDIEPKLAEFSSAWRGFCSYKGIVGGIPTRLPDKTVEVEMTIPQYEKYLEARGKKDIYYAVTIASLYFDDEERNEIVSPKFAKALDLIEENQKTLCSLPDGQKVAEFTLVFCGYIEKGVFTFEEFMKRNGWTKYTKRNTSPVGSNRRFAVLTGFNSKDAGELADAANRGLFNVLIMSEVGSEGLNLNLCSQVIFLTIQFQPTSTDQIIGRCLRKTSKPTTVQVVFLISVPPKDEDDETSVEMATDRSIYNFVLNKRKLFKPWYNAIKDASFECNEVLVAAQTNELEIETLVSNMVRS